MNDDPKKKKREEGATFFTMWLCFSNILVFIKTINYSYSRSSLASSQSFPSSNRMSPPHFFTYHLIHLFSSSHCHCHYCTTCNLDFWKALFRKCLLNNRKVQANIRKYLLYVLLNNASYLFIFLNCVNLTVLDLIRVLVKNS